MSDKGYGRPRGPGGGPVTQGPGHPSPPAPLGTRTGPTGPGRRRFSPGPPQNETRGSGREEGIAQTSGILREREMQLQKAQRTPSNIKLRKITLRHETIKMLKVRPREDGKTPAAEWLERESQQRAARERLAATLWLNTGLERAPPGSRWSQGSRAAGLTADELRVGATGPKQALCAVTQGGAASTMRAAVTTTDARSVGHRHAKHIQHARGERVRSNEARGSDAPARGLRGRRPRLGPGAA